MGLSFRIKKNFNIPTHFDFSSELKTIARKVIIPSIQSGMKKNIDITGKKFPNLEESTKRMKFKKYAHARPLFADQELINAFVYKARGTNKVIVYIKTIRNKIAEYLQIEGVGKKKKKFKFFGITDGMEQDAMSIMNRKLKVLLHG